MPLRRILHLRTSEFYGGPERQIHQHALAVEKSEYEIILGSFSVGPEGPELLQRAAENGIETHKFPIRGSYDPGAVKALRDYLRSSRIDLLCTHEYRSTIIGLIAAAGLPTRVIAFSRGWTQEGAKMAVFYWIETRLMRFSNHIVAVSAEQKRRLERRGLPSDRISVVHNAVDPAAFSPIPAVDLREEYGLPKESVIAISGGRFTAEKGQRFFVEAAIEALERVPNLCCILFGQGPERDRLSRFVREHGAENRILLPGFEKNIIGCLKGADILVNPSLSEGLPNIVLEAMACEVPVIATAVGGVPELISDEESGLLVPPMSVSSLADALVRLATAPAHRRTLSTNARDRVIHAFSFPAQARKLFSLYEQTLTNP